MESGVGLLCSRLNDSGLSESDFKRPGLSLVKFQIFTTDIASCHYHHPFTSITYLVNKLTRTGQKVYEQ
jgi:hypothetical protein